MEDKTMDNQQETQTKPTEVELAWLAGIIEGEGWITMSAHRCSKKEWAGGYILAPKIGVCNTDAGIIRKIRQIFDKLGTNNYIFEYRTTCQNFKSGTTILEVSTKRLDTIKNILTSIMPYMAGQKKQRAELLLDYVEKRLSHKYEPYTEEEINIAKKFFEECVSTKGKKRSKALLRFFRDFTPPPTLERN